MSSCGRIVEEEEKGQSMKEERISLRGWSVRDRAVGTVRRGTVQEQGYQFLHEKSISGLGLHLCHPDLSQLPAAGRKVSARQD